ncbi:hypothetical protein BDV19DRAFT_241059 [Aspergillus venezuelensis]
MYDGCGCRAVGSAVSRIRILVAVLSALQKEEEQENKEDRKYGYHPPPMACLTRFARRAEKWIVEFGEGNGIWKQSSGRPHLRSRARDSICLPPKPSEIIWH